MAKIRIASINVCGLNDANKRQRVAIELKRLRADVLCLQDTHMEGARAKLMEQLGYKIVACMQQSVRVKGVAILSRTSEIKWKNCQADTLGQWIIAEGSSRGFCFTLCSIYGSTWDDPQAFLEMNRELAARTTPVILCGDLNINGLGIRWESGGCKYVGRTYKASRALLAMIQDNGLTDIWALTKSADPGDTYYTAPHQLVARLDYFFTSSRLSLDCAIEKYYPRVFSDHNPLILTIHNKVGLDI